MKKTFLILIGILTITIACKSLKSNKNNHNSILLYQNGKETVIAKVDQITIKKNNFSLRFYNKMYNPKTKEFYAAQIAAFLEPKQLETAKIGMKINDVIYFGPGSGMATHRSGKYECIFFKYGHHYLMYNNESDKRLNLLKSENELHKFEFEINSIKFKDKEVSLSETTISTLYFAILIDRNLNGIIDENELTKMTVNLK